MSKSRAALAIGTVVCGLLFLSGCATPLTNEGAAVLIKSQQQEVAKCKYLGQVTGSSNWGGVAATGVGFESSMNQLKNKVAQMGGNTLKTQTISNTMGGTNMIGDAYLCPRD